MTASTGEDVSRDPAASDGDGLSLVLEALRANVTLEDVEALRTRRPGIGGRAHSLALCHAFAWTRDVGSARPLLATIAADRLLQAGVLLLVADIAEAIGETELLVAHCLRRAVTASLIAARLGHAHVAPFVAVAALSEVGLLIRARSDLAAALRVGGIPAHDRLVFERAQGAVDHVARGVELATILKLPHALKSAIEVHHAPKMPLDALSQVVWTSERVSAIWEGGDVARLHAEACSCLSQVGLSSEAIDVLILQIPSMVEQGGRALNQTTPRQPGLNELLMNDSRRLIELNQSYERAVRQLEALLAQKDELSERLRRANGELARLATTDTLTGLATRRALDEVMGRELEVARSSGGALSLIVLDVDHFKQVNDAYGHATGDAALKTVAELVTTQSAEGTFSARYGGEEFVLVLPGRDISYARTIAEKLRNALSERTTPSPAGPLKVTASFGVAGVLRPASSDTPEGLFARADAALYEAKRTGRNRVCCAPNVSRTS